MKKLLFIGLMVLLFLTGCLADDDLNEFGYPKGTEEHLGDIKVALLNTVNALDANVTLSSTFESNGFKMTSNVAIDKNYTEIETGDITLYLSKKTPTPGETIYIIGETTPNNDEWVANEREYSQFKDLIYNHTNFERIDMEVFNNCKTDNNSFFKCDFNNDVYYVSTNKHFITKIEMESRYTKVKIEFSKYYSTSVIYLPAYTIR